MQQRPCRSPEQDFAHLTEALSLNDTMLIALSLYDPKLLAVSLNDTGLIAAHAGGLVPQRPSSSPKKQPQDSTQSLPAPAKPDISFSQGRQQALARVAGGRVKKVSGRAASKTPAKASAKTPGKQQLR